MFFCFKQKTAYEMRISDWSSDVCSSDLSAPVNALTREFDALRARVQTTRGAGLWRALDELAASRGFDVWLRAEHPQLATMAAMNRRDFLRYAAASMALGGIAEIGRAHV